MTRDFDLVVIGDVNPDLILAAPDLVVEFGQRESLAKSVELTLGGSSSIVASASARLGLRTAFIGLFGDDAYGSFCLDQLRSHGVDTTSVVVDPNVTTSLTVILQRDDDRAIVTYPGSIARLQPSHVNREILTRTHHVHVGSYYLLDGLRDAVTQIFADAHDAGATTSLDTNDDPQRTWQLGDVLDHCDVLLPNEQEAAIFTGEDNTDDALAALAQRVNTVAVTAGSRGALAQRADRRIEIHPTPVAEVVDAVGAGDNFDAGFLYGFIHQWSLERCLRAGIGNAARSLTGTGGTSMLGTIDDALAASAHATVVTH